MWWASASYLRLLAVRLAGQLGDGVVQAALAAYALFSDDRTDPVELAVAAAVLLLPYSVLGPFVGVLLDRWSRRQVLLVANLVRAAVVVGLAALVAGDAPEVAVYAVVLVALAINRFLLAGLSAALPHTVADEHLTAANAVTPTLGTGAFVVGLGLGGVARAVLDGPLGGAGAGGAVVLAGAVAYVVAALAAALTARPALGPDHVVAPPSPRHVAAGLADALRHLGALPVVATSLVVVAVLRLGLGVVVGTAVLVLRNDRFAGDRGEAVAAVGLLTAVTAAGFLAAAVVTPWVARRLGRARTVLVLGGLAVPLVLAGAFVPASVALAGALGLLAQAVKICVDALVQAEVADDFRGRVFSLYDLALNVAVVSAAVLVALGADRAGVPGAAPAVTAAAVLAAAVLVGAAGRARVVGPRSPGPRRVSDRS